MQLIIIEDSIYKVTNKQYKIIRQKQVEIESRKDQRGNAMDMDDFLESLKPTFKFLGKVMFDWRL